MLCFNMILYDTNCPLEFIRVTFLAQKLDLGWFCANESDQKATSPFFFFHRKDQSNCIRGFWSFKKDYCLDCEYNL
jgi:hypothetical protein